jgi:Base plate wedge protein 53
MSYFNKFPGIQYELGGRYTILRDILCRSAFISEYKPYTDLYASYTIIDGDTPQSLALRYYGSAKYHWVILMFNEIHNPYFDWPVDAFVLKNICIEKYGEDTMYMTRHCIDADSNIVNEVKIFDKEVTWVPPEIDPDTTPISFYDYEEQLNDSKREIHILRPELLGDFMKQFGASLNE